MPPPNAIKCDVIFEQTANLFGLKTRYYKEELLFQEVGKGIMVPKKYKGIGASNGVNPAWPAHFMTPSFGKQATLRKPFDVSSMNIMVAK